MCSVEDDGDLKPIPTSRIESKAPEAIGTNIRSCVKCSNTGVVISRINDSFCRNCFQVYVVHRFRAAIGKSHLIRDGEKVLVAFSGGANSAALMHLIQDGLSLRAHKKLRFIPTVIHVDETSILSLNELDQQSLQGKVRQLMIDSGFPAFITRLDIGLTLQSSRPPSPPDPGAPMCWPVLSSGPGGESAAQTKLNSLLDGLASVSSREDFIVNLRNQLLITIARHMGISKVLTAECSTRLAVRILSDVAQGRGSQVALNTRFSDSRNEDVLFVRPLRDLNVKDLANYNNLFNVDSAFIPVLTTKGEMSASIDRLTEGFVTGLQSDYQSTVPNIVRTSEKLGLPDLSAIKCIFCKAPQDTSGAPPPPGTATALDAVNFSSSLSQHKINPDSGPTTKCGELQSLSIQSTSCDKGDGCCQSNTKKRLQMNELVDHLCYGCRLSLDDFRGVPDNLPFFLKKEVELAEQRNKMREHIADFLLEDDVDP